MQTSSANEATKLLRPGESQGLLLTAKVILLGGAGFCADGYDLYVINLAMALISEAQPGSLTPAGQGFCTSVTLFGVMLGQLTFGPVADILGRKKSSVITAFLTVFGALASACSVSTIEWCSFAVQLSLCRFILGFGIGGEYPLSAAITKEVPSNVSLTRTQLLLVNSALFNVGGLIMSTFVYICIMCSIPASFAWRMALAGGAVPSLIAFGLRLRMEEPQVEPDLTKNEVRGVSLFSSSLRHDLLSRLWVLVAASMAWGLYNFSAYGQGSFGSLICTLMFGKDGETSRQKLVRDVAFAWFGCVFTLVGNFFAFWLETRGTFPRLLSLILGFIFMGTLTLLCSFLYGVLPTSWSWLLMGVCFMWNASSGFMGALTYLIPAESFSASVRATAVGVAAASGKFGAALGTLAFPLLAAASGLKKTLLLFGGVPLLGAIAMWLFAPAIELGPWDEQKQYSEK